VSKQEEKVKEHRRQTPVYFALLLVLLGFLHFGGASVTIARTRQPMGSSPKTHLSSSTGASGGVPLKRVKDENFYQNARDARRLKLLTGGKPIRDKRGLNIQAAEHPKGENDTESGRVAHDRRWFGAWILRRCVCRAYSFRIFRKHSGRFTDYPISFPHESVHAKV
jgi:hypothetical protein